MFYTLIHQIDIIGLSLHFTAARCPVGNHFEQVREIDDSIVIRITPKGRQDRL